MADKTEAEARQDQALVAAIGFNPSATGQVAVMPIGSDLRSLEAFQDRPNRVVADHTFVDVDSLAEYINRFGGGSTMITANQEKQNICCVIDGDIPANMTMDGEGSLGSHKSHKAKFQAYISEKLNDWLKIENKPMSQTEFGLFLEDRYLDVVVPDSADVMEMIMKFDAIKKVNFQSSTRLHDGQRQFVYNEENETRGAITLTDHLVINVPVLEGMQRQAVKFMLRYRIVEQRLVFYIAMASKKDIFREAFDACVSRLSDKVGDHFIYKT